MLITYTDNTDKENQFKNLHTEAINLQWNYEMSDSRSGCSRKNLKK